ncbi:secreted protein containing S-layer like domain [mine drainage metagenome]|uniref:Secreted protein containing S-layer like domain n=2 Tax=mine drainage metagenome TaxID=410659 RepID=T1CSV3_9ZZZZ
MRLRGYRHFALLGLLALVYALPGTAAAGSVTVQVSTSATGYQVGSLVTITGVVETSTGQGIADAQVALEAQGKATGNVYWVDQVTSSQSGSFADSFVLPGTTSTDTALTIFAVSEGTSAQTSITVTTPPTPPTGPPSTPSSPGTPQTPAACSPAGSGTVLSTSITQTDVYLETKDNCLSLFVPTGESPLGTTITVTESTLGSSGLPPGQEQAATPDFGIGFQGASLSMPLGGTFDYSSSVIGSLSSSRVGLFYRSSPAAPWVWYKDTVNAAADQVGAAVQSAGEYLVAVNTTRFNDIPKGYFAAGAIDLLLGRDAISGFPDGGFHPDASVTRAQFAKMLVLTLGLPLPAQATSAGFSDVQGTAWYAPYVDAAVQAGLVKGVTATTFEPGTYITRGQIAVLVARAMGSYKPTNPLQVSFTDQSQIPAWALPSVMQAADAGIIHGLSNGSFGAQGNATRAEAAELLANLVTVTGQ